VTKGLLADIEPVRERLGGDVERRMQSAVNEALQRSRQRALSGQGGDATEAAAAFVEPWRQYELQVVKLRVSSAGQSCAAGRLALQTVLGLGHMRAVMGMDAGGGLNDYPGLVDTVARVCVLEEFELCVQEHVIHRMAGVWRGYERQYALMGLIGVAVNDAIVREARELTIKCLTFNLKFESTATMRTPEGGGYESTVTSDITLRFDPDADKISGNAPLVNEAFEWFVPVCDVTSILGGGGPFEVINLAILSAQADETHGDTNFLLSYVPGETSESATVSCPDGPPVTMPAGPYWTGMFVTTHQAELDTTFRFGGGYIAIDWEVFGDEYYAKKEWIKDDGEAVEAGSFKLYHTPGQ
jgi:hypothetical protein